MKKIMILAASAAMLIGATACSEKNNSAPVGQNEKLVYTGVLPAADVEGIRYTLTLDYDQDDNNMKGDFDLVETYFSTDSVAPMGVKDFLSVRSEGDFVVETKEGKKYLKLVADPKESDSKADKAPVYFLAESDSTLVLVNNELEKPTAPGLNYTLKLTNK